MFPWKKLKSVRNRHAQLCEDHELGICMASASSGSGDRPHPLPRSYPQSRNARASRAAPSCGLAVYSQQLHHLQPQARSGGGVSAGQGHIPQLLPEGPLLPPVTLQPAFLLGFLSQEVTGPGGEGTCLTWKNARAHKSFCHNLEGGLHEKRRRKGNKPG